MQPRRARRLVEAGELIDARQHRLVHLLLFHHARRGVVARSRFVLERDGTRVDARRDGAVLGCAVSLRARLAKPPALRVSVGYCGSACASALLNLATVPFAAGWPRMRM